MQPIRKIQQATHFKPVMSDEGKELLTPCSPGDAGAQEMNWMEIETDQLREPELTIKDFIKSIKRNRPTVNAADIENHIKFTDDFGQEGN